MVAFLLNKTPILSFFSIANVEYIVFLEIKIQLFKFLLNKLENLLRRKKQNIRKHLF